MGGLANTPILNTQLLAVPYQPPEEGSGEGEEVVTFCFRKNRDKNGMQGFKWIPSKGIRPMGNGSYKWQVVGLNSVLIL